MYIYIYTHTHVCTHTPAWGTVGGEGVGGAFAAARGRVGAVACAAVWGETLACPCTASAAVCVFVCECECECVCVCVCMCVFVCAAV